MRIVKKTTTAKKGGKSKKKASATDHLKNKTLATHKVIENLLAQMKKMEVDALRYALEKHLGRDLVKEDAEKIKKVKKENETGYTLCFDGLQLGRIDRQHSADPKAQPNFRIVFTPFEVTKQLDLKVA